MPSNGWFVQDMQLGRKWSHYKYVVYHLDTAVGGRASSGEKKTQSHSRTFRKHHNVRAWTMCFFFEQRQGNPKGSMLLCSICLGPAVLIRERLWALSTYQIATWTLWSITRALENPLQLVGCTVQHQVVEPGDIAAEA